jgi:hypothetical protein
METVSDTSRVPTSTGCSNLHQYFNLFLTKRGSVTRFFTSGFFHESGSPKPLIVPSGRLEFFSKILGDIRSSMQMENIFNQKILL